MATLRITSWEGSGITNGKIVTTIEAVLVAAIPTLLTNLQVGEVHGDNITCLMKNAAILPGSLCTSHGFQTCIGLPYTY